MIQLGAEKTRLMDTANISMHQGIRRFYKLKIKLNSGGGMHRQDGQ